MSRIEMSRRRWGFLTGLDQKASERFWQVVRERTLPVGAWVCRPGDPADTFYFVDEGMLCVSTESEDGRCVATELLRPGECGGCCCLGQVPGTTVLGARAILPSRIGAIERREFVPLIAENPSLAFGLLDVLQSRERKLEQRLIRVLSLPALERVRDLLSDVGAASVFGMQQLPLTHQDIADLLGLTRETVSRAIAELRRAECCSGVVAS